MFILFPFRYSTVPQLVFSLVHPDSYHMLRSSTWRIARTSIHPRRYLINALQPNDNVILQRLPPDRYASPILVRLVLGASKDTHKGRILHDNIIGKLARQVVESTVSQSSEKKGVLYRIHQVTLDEYVRLTRRLVTPLYPQDAQLIVSMLDLHPELPSPDDSPDGPLLEILEAGTGHGALTLYLSRAIHAANPPIPLLSSDSAEEDADDIISRWKPSRRAVLHSVELSPKYSKHATNVVRGFRRGQYYGNVDFHVGSVGSWVTAELANRHGQPFLDHAFLDLAGSEDHLSAVAAALKPNGKLIVFNPSLTQIMDCVAKVKDQSLPLELETVVELGVNGGTGGREWDVRAVLPRAARVAVEQSPVVDVGEGIGGGGVKSPVVSDENDDDEGALSSFDESPFRQTAATPAVERQEGWKMVCRPKVGDMVVGGGFIAKFVKIRIE